MVPVDTIETRLQPTAEGAVLYASAAADGGTRPADWFDPQYWQASGTVEQLGAGRGAALHVAGGGHDWVLRHFHRGGMVASLLGDRYLWNGAERTRGFAEFRLLAALKSRGLRVPAPIAARYRRSGVHYRADLITGFIPGAVTLAERVRGEGLDAATAARVGAGIAEFHAAGAYHADLNAHNVLLDARQLWLVDFDRGTLREPARPWQLGTLMRLRRSLIKIGAARDGEAQFDRDFWLPLARAWERALDGFAASAAADGTAG